MGKARFYFWEEHAAFVNSHFTEDQFSSRLCTQASLFPIYHGNINHVSSSWYYERPTTLLSHCEGSFIPCDQSRSSGGHAGDISRSLDIICSGFHHIIWQIGPVNFKSLKVFATALKQSWWFNSAVETATTLPHTAWKPQGCCHAWECRACSNLPTKLLSPHTSDEKNNLEHTARINYSCLQRISTRFTL